LCDVLFDVWLDLKSAVAGFASAYFPSRIVMRHRIGVAFLSSSTDCTTPVKNPSLGPIVPLIPPMQHCFGRDSGALFVGDIELAH
jgi:hypothetical protein